MPASSARRPLPAVAFLLALTVLTAIVWWRVLHRSDATGTASTSKPSATSSCSTAGRVLPQPGSVTVTVLNAAQKTGLAASVETQLKARGFATAGVGNEPSPYSGVAQIRYGTTGKAGAQLLSYYLPGSKLAPVKRSNATVDVVLGTGFKTLASDAAVNAAAKKAGRAC
jgi:hypothetical protein